MQTQVAELIKQLKAIFSGWPASLRTAEHEKHYGREFMKAMAQFGITTPEQIKVGMVRARKEAAAGERYLPSGATFAGWCKPSLEDQGIDSFESAYPKILNRAWGELHPAFQVVAMETYVTHETVRSFQSSTLRDVKKKVIRRRYDIALLKGASEYESRRVAKIFYDEVCARVIKGEEFKRIEAISDQSSKVNRHYVRPACGNPTMRKLLADLGRGPQTA